MFPLTFVRAVVVGYNRQVPATGLQNTEGRIVSRADKETCGDERHA
jgi:hypothetical protein